MALLLFTIREPDKGANESSFILKAAGMDTHTQQEAAPRVLLGAAVTRLMRIRSIYYELVAVAILGFAGTGIPLFGSLYYQQVWHQGTAHRSEIYAVIGLSAFLGIPVAYLVGDKLFRRAPQAPLVLAAASITVYGGVFAISLYMPELWMVVALQFLANAAIAPLSISIFQTLAATAPPEMRAICFGMFGVFALVFGGFAGGILLGAISSVAGVTTALVLIGPVCALGGVLLLLGSRHVRRDITLVIEDVLERYAEGRRRQAGGAIPALQIHNLDFFYGPNQILFDINLEVPEGAVVALLGTNGAGKSTLLRTVAGLEHPHRGVIRLFGTNCTFLEPEQIIGQDTALLVGGKMTFPGLTVRDNLRIGEHTFRRDTARARIALDEAIDLFPELRERLDHHAGTLSGGEQQMLALARVMMTRPRLLMIDELALGLAPMTVDRLMDIVRRVNDAGTTVILVEQSINRAMHLADHAFFLERGTIRFDGPTAELLERDDLLRPVFLVPPRRRRPGGCRDRPDRRRPPGAGLQRARVRPGGGHDHRSQLRPAGAGPGAHLPHQPGAQLLPGPARRGRRRVHGQVLLRLRHRLLGCAGLRPGPGRGGGGGVGAGAAPAVQASPRAGHGGHHRPGPGALPVHGAAVRPPGQADPALPGALPPVVHPRRLRVRPRPGHHPGGGPAGGPGPGRCSSGSPPGAWPCGPRPRTPIRPGCRGCGCAAPPPSPGSSPPCCRRSPPSSTLRARPRA